MEIKARYRLIGLFMLVVIGLGFGFVFWLQNAGGLSERKTYQIRFSDSVGGVQVGSPVLFGGMRVGEVTGLGLSSQDPHVIIVTIGVEKSTPLRADTAVRVESQGLMGSPAVALYGGSPDLPKLDTLAQPPMLVAAADAAQGLTDMARHALGRLDKILGDNAGDLHDTISNLKTFSATLAHNSDKIDALIGGLEKNFAAPPKPPAATFDLAAPSQFPQPRHAPDKQLAVPMPTAVIALDTQKVLELLPGGETRPLEDVQWSDSLPNLMQAKILQSFENAHFGADVSRPLEGATGTYQLLIDLRRFGIAPEPTAKAQIAFGAKIVGDNGKILAARQFSGEAPAKGSDAAAKVAALNEAFRAAATDLVTWTAASLFDGKAD